MSYVLILIVVYLLIGLAFAYVVAAIAPGGLENNWRPLRWTLSEVYFMVVLVIIWPYVLYGSRRKG